MSYAQLNINNMFYANDIKNVFSKYDEDIILDKNGIIRSNHPQICPKCETLMVKNGSNTLRKEEVGKIKIGRYICPICRTTVKDPCDIWNTLNDELNTLIGDFTLKCRILNVSYQEVCFLLSTIFPKKINKDKLYNLSKKRLDSLEIPEIVMPDDIIIIHYDEQHPKKGRSQKYRLTVLDARSKRPILEEIVDSKDGETVKRFLKDIYVEGKQYFIVTDLDLKYPNVLSEVFGKNHVHQKCLFHLNQLICKDFPKTTTIYQEYVKYKFLNIFYDRTSELEYLENLLIEEEKKVNNGEKIERKWLLKEKNKFYKYLKDLENERRRKKQNLPQNLYSEVLLRIEGLKDFIYNVDNNKINFSLQNALIKRLKKIIEDFDSFTEFYFVPGAPATNNAVENYYSTSLKTDKKKQMRTDEGILGVLKLAALKRAGVFSSQSGNIFDTLTKFKLLSSFG